MNAKDPDALSAVIARQRGRARLRAATVALGAASLVTAGAVAYHLPGAAHAISSVSATATTASPGASGVHSTSGGSSVAASVSNVSATARSAGSGGAHATSGGS